MKKGLKKIGKQIKEKVKAFKKKTGKEPSVIIISNEQYELLTKEISDFYYSNELTSQQEQEQYISYELSVEDVTEVTVV